MDNTIVLRLKDRSMFGERPYLNMQHAILTTDYDQWPCGTPFFMDKSVMEEPRIPVVRGFCLFPPRQGVIMDTDLEVAKNCVQLVNLRPIGCRHRTIDIDAFDIGKFQRLCDYIKNLDGITFVIKDAKARSNIPRLFKQMTKYFKYHSLFQSTFLSNKFLNGDDDEVLGLISFLNLPYCVPIFNSKRVDGMGVSYSEVVRKASEDKSRPIRRLRFDLALTNYEENLFVIDGVTVNPKSSLNDKWILEFENWIASEPSRKDLNKMKKNKLMYKTKIPDLSAGPTVKVTHEPKVGVTIEQGYGPSKWYGTDASTYTWSGNTGND